MKTTRYDTLKYWNGKEILRECKDKNRLCVHANVWNTCVDKPCEKGSKLLGKEADQFIVDEANAYTKGEKMTNREWLEKQSDIIFAKAISENLIGEYPIDIVRWLNKEHYEPKELTHAQVCQAFDFKFANRRAISPEEVNSVIEELFK